MGREPKLYKYSSGLEFGGRCRYLFWIFPIGDHDGPEFEIVISANGYKDKKIMAWDVFKNEYDLYEDFPKTKKIVEGEELELKIYENTFILEK